MRRMSRRMPALVSMVLLLGGCANAPERNPMATWVRSPNHDARDPIVIVLHATEQGSAGESLDTLRTANAGGPVSAHYLVGDDGRIWQLVEESRRAWHAGGGRWGTITDLNSASIGIELDNDGSEPFTTAQIDSLLVLLEDICERHGIPRSMVIAHADLAPTRKRDPGAHFPWATLAEAGFGTWPRGPLVDPPPGFDPWMALRVVGYSLDDTTPHDERAAAVRAFHRRFRGMDDTDPAATLDAEDARILYALTR